MMKKLLATLLALAMLALPVLSLADGDAMSMSIRLSNLNVPLTGDADTDAYLNGILNDLLDALEVTLAAKEFDGETLRFSGSLNLSNTPALTMDVQMEKDTILMGSNLLGSDVVVITPEEMTAFFENNKDAMTESGITEEQYQQMIQQMTTALTSPAAMAGSADLDALDMSDLDLTATQNAAQALVESTESVQGELTEQPEGCDPAVSVYTFTTDGEKFMALVRAAVRDVMNTSYMTTLMESMSSMFELEGEQINVKELVLSIYDAMSLQDDLVRTIYFDENHEPVREEVHFTLLMNGDTTNPLICDAILNRVTQDTVSYNFDLTMSGKEDASVHMLGNMKLIDEDSFAFEMSILDNQTAQKIDLALECREEETGEKTVTDILFSINVAEDSSTTPEGVRLHVQVTEIDNEAGDCTVVVDVLPPDDDTPYITLTVTASETAALEKMNGTNAVHPLSMSAEELNAWAEGVTVSAQTALVSAIQLLPESVLNMVMSMLQQ